MGLKRKIKESIMRHALKKRAVKKDFDDVAGEMYKMPADAEPSQNNSYYFSAHGTDGSSLFLRLGERGGGAKEFWLAYYDKSGTAYVNSYQDYTAENCPVSLECITPLKEWNIKFKGAMQCAQTDGNRIMKAYGEEIDAEFCATFYCTEKLYNFSRDGDDLPLARAVAAEKWSRALFDELQLNDQIHTEQAGRLKGKFTADGRGFDIDMPAMRDHSYGRREWHYMNRHIWLMSVSEEESFNASLVSYPALKGLRTGYRISGGETINIIDCTPLESMPEDLSGTFSYTCKEKSGRIFTVQCDIKAVFPFSMGGGKYTIYEGIADYMIDGKKGRGIAEFGYNADTARWRNGGKQ